MQKEFLTTLVIALLASAFPAAGSAFAASPEADAPEDITGLSITYNHMSRHSALSFDLREEGGEVLFSCSFFMNGEEIVLEKVSVAPEYMQRLREIATRQGFANMRERAADNRPGLRDAPIHRMNVYWPGRRSMHFNYWPGGGRVEALFWEIAEACINRPGAPEDISALFYNHVEVSERGRFNFSLRSDKGNYLFSARYHAGNRERVVISSVPVDTGHVRDMRELVKELGILDKEGLPLRDTSAPPYPYARLSLHWPDMRIMRFDESALGGEELKQFFQTLAQIYAD